MNLKIADISGQSEKLWKKIDDTLTEAEQQSGVELDFSLLDDIAETVERNVKIVFVGQYSAGKSSIIKMLTNKDDIAIGAGITTQESTSYNWNGMEIVDTPGIATGFRKDHDEIAKRAIAQADLLIFVITNEGFDSLIVDNFRQIAYEMDSEKKGAVNSGGKINELMLVVNKMERMGNTPENQEILWNDICKGLSLGDVNLPKTCFISAKSYLDSLEEADEEICHELENRSGYEKFITALNEFVNEKGYIGQLIAPVQQMEAVLRDAVQRLSGSTDNPNADAADTILHRLISDLERTKKNGARDLNEIFFHHASEIRSYGRELASNIGSNEGMDTEGDIERKLRNISEKCQKEVENKIDEIYSQIRADVNELISSPLAVGLEANINLNVPIEDSSKLNTVLGTLKKLNNIVGKIDKSMILKIGHLFKYKFKPWQAVKLVKWLDKWIPIIGGVLDVFMEISDKKKAEDAIRKMNEARRDTVASFNSVADAFEQDGRIFVNEYFIGQLQDILDERYKEVQLLDSMKKKKSKYVEELNSLIDECRSLQRDIRKNSVING